ncbi:MAG: spore germination protein [Peptococcaceae bacterium]|nr:spore germination protein [Peptococcaceae bacterium]
MKKLILQQPGRIASSSGSVPEVPVSGVLNQDMEWLKQHYVRCSDLIYRHITIGGHQHRQAAVFYFDGMTDSGVVHDNILRPLLLDAEIAEIDAETEENFRNFFEYLKERLLPAGEITVADDLKQGAQAMMNGDVLLIIDGCRQAIVIDAKGFPQRPVGKAENEVVLRGPQEAFTEAMRINTALIRRHLRTNQLKLEEKTLGRYTRTQVAIVYLDGVANENIIAEVHRRLDNIKEVDSILDSSCIEQYIEDSPFSVFPQMQYTERPDKVAASLLEGRVALVVDGSPDVILLPLMFVQLLQSPEDYYTRLAPGTFMRWIRYMGLLIAILFPSLYVAVTSYHPEMLPLNLLLSIAAAREGVPFPAFVEALIMELCFELLREASIRLPGAIGNTIGIVGALVIGDAAVSAHLVAPQMVIVVAITAIGSFTVPSMEASYPIRLLRFPLMLLAAGFGLYGVALGVMAILLHLVHLRSFGFPYLEPLAPLKLNEMRDVLIRAPRWQMMVRPQFREPYRKNTGILERGFWQRRVQPLKQKGDDSRGEQ